MGGERRGVRRGGGGPARGKGPSPYPLAPQKGEVKVV